jgi:cytochrome b
VTIKLAGGAADGCRWQLQRLCKVWDPFVRVFHWSLVALFGLAWATEDVQALHQPVGYAILALVALRIGWGFIGSPHARFDDFVRAPRATLAYALELLKGRAPRLLGHTPLGAMMVIALLASLIATGASGWMMTSATFRAMHWLEDLHEGLAWLTLLLVATHLIGVLLMSIVHRENLVRAMLTGLKRTS